MDNNTTLKASCLCGQAKTEIPFEVGSGVLFCSCASCRHCIGAPFLTGVGAAASWTPPQNLLDKMAPYDFSDRLTQFHCRTCGTIMFTRVAWSVADANKGVHWDVMSGILEKFDGILCFAAHEFVADAIDGGFADFITTVNDKPVERWTRRPGKSEQVPVFWRHPDQAKVQLHPYEKLHASCKCGGVEFWISRPSERSKDAIKDSKQGTWWLMDNGNKFLGIMCACNSCRLDTGMEFQAWVPIPVIDISLDAKSEKPLSSFDFGTLKEYRSSSKVSRYHCATCGASIFYSIDDRPGLVNVTAGILDAPEGARAGSWVEYWTARLGSKEDALPRAESLVVGMEKSQKEFAERYGLVHKRPTSD